MDDEKLDIVREWQVMLKWHPEIDIRSGCSMGSSDVICIDDFRSIIEDYIRLKEASLKKDTSPNDQRPWWRIDKNIKLHPMHCTDEWAEAHHIYDLKNASYHIEEYEKELQRLEKIIIVLKGKFDGKND